MPFSFLIYIRLFYKRIISQYIITAIYYVNAILANNFNE